MNQEKNPKEDFRNVVSYLENDKSEHYNKICMISIEKGSLISGRKGTKIWEELFEQNVSQVRQLLDDPALHLYYYDKWSFFLAAGKKYPESQFMLKAEQMFQECGYCFCKEHNLTVINNFHIIIGEGNLLEMIQLCMSTEKDENKRFQVYSAQNDELIRQTDEQLHMTTVISDALVNNRIIPYFQPIRDNRTKEIRKYEALMRLSDKDAHIYMPGQFLEVAKDYHLYLQLSQKMIRKVLELFRDRDECVFLNLSAYDIASEENREFILKLLSQFPRETCERIAFEILESEKVTDYDQLMEFLGALRSRGVKIAIDDFGAGYSNFKAIIQVNPDFIKIDGDLIIDCDKDPMKKLCLQAITELARGIDAELIAEHVENDGEQQTIESVQIEYTQGYYFSKPLPYSSLKPAESEVEVKE